MFVDYVGCSICCIYTQDYFMCHVLSVHVFGPVSFTSARIIWQQCLLFSLSSGVPKCSAVFSGAVLWCGSLVLFSGAVLWCCWVCGPVGSQGYCKHPWLEAGVWFLSFQSDVCSSQLLVPSLHVTSCSYLQLLPDVGGTQVCDTTGAVGKVTEDSQAGNIRMVIKLCSVNGCNTSVIADKFTWIQWMLKKESQAWWYSVLLKVFLIFPPRKQTMMTQVWSWEYHQWSCFV